MESLMQKFYAGKNVLVTGSTGFKGSWLIRVLTLWGANVYGYALSPKEQPNLHEIANAKSNYCQGDIRNLSELIEYFKQTQPDIVFHLAAQPLVRRSYADPVETYSTNVLGTVNILEAVRQTKSVRSFLNVTTDKVYKNLENKDIGYKETDELNGYDPYSNSKSCSELVTDCYKKSFFAKSNVSVSTARSGNVIEIGRASCRERV
jgi:CDP-glucose 4,6-dehydratase